MIEIPISIGAQKKAIPIGKVTWKRAQRNGSKKITAKSPEELGMSKKRKTRELGIQIGFKKNCELETTF